MSLSIPFPFGWLLNKKAARVKVNISLAFLYWVGIALHPWPFVSDVAIFVLKGDVKLQLTNYSMLVLGTQIIPWVSSFKAKEQRNSTALTTINSWLHPKFFGRDGTPTHHVYSPTPLALLPVWLNAQKVWRAVDLRCHFLQTSMPSVCRFRSCLIFLLLIMNS